MKHLLARPREISGVATKLWQPESMVNAGYKINLFDSLLVFIFIQVDPILWLNRDEKEKEK